MNLNLSGHHLEITPAIRSYVTSKLERIERHFDRVTDISVVMSVEKLQQKIEAVVHMRGKDIFIEARHDDLYAAIDNLTDKLDRQIIKHKEKAAGSRAASTSLKHSAIDQEPAQ
ncbi:MAG TPA: ribosome-associated translation inhibitor RaiA [Burkholderiales bacterium]|jgi:putative sigma-54 modulation protein|nr:ribosome-associated translation inhibitor RaiA [Burkholderiales bacterium]